MADLRFLITDLDSTSGDYGGAFALTPGLATGIPMPAFRSGPVTPASGTLVGEAFLNTNSSQAFVWTGTRWSPIAPAAITVYPSDADVLADLVAAPGTYATAQDTGNFFIRVAGQPAGAPDTWRMVGVRTYADVATLSADTPADGTIGVALAEASVWLRAGGIWHAQSMSIYTTEVLLLAATPPDGTIGIAQDTGLLYSRLNGAWRRLNSPTISVAANPPATPAQGDVHFDDTTGTGMVWSGAQWMSMNAEPIGEVKMFAGQTPPPNFLLCDGAPIPAQFPMLIALIGPNTPNLMEQFPRFGVPEAGFISNQDTTRRPRTNFTTDGQGNHVHPIDTLGHVWDHSLGGNNVGRGDGSGSGGGHVNINSGNAGLHTHTILGGGDAETAPVHVRLLPIIRAA